MSCPSFKPIGSERVAEGVGNWCFWHSGLPNGFPDGAPADAGRAHCEELFPRVGFIVTTLETDNRAVCAILQQAGDGGAVDQGQYVMDRASLTSSTAMFSNFRLKASGLSAGMVPSACLTLAQLKLPLVVM